MGTTNSASRQVREPRGWFPRRTKFIVPVLSGIGLALGFWASAGKTTGAAQQPPVSSALLCEGYAGLPQGDDGHAGMALVRGGKFLMGSNDHYAEEAPAHRVKVSDFLIDKHAVTNAQFKKFVEATGYVTLAERMPYFKYEPELPAFMRQPGSAVFVMPDGTEFGRWRYVQGASWRSPTGPGSNIENLMNHPVVHVAYEDALAYAKWAERDLPTEAQWEYAARGGFDNMPYVWGAAFAPDGKTMANTWQGEFPFENELTDRYMGTSPVGCFPPNGYGLYDMAGNVWQWTSTWFRPEHDSREARDPQGPDEAESYDPRSPGVPAKVIKGGSHLCAANYCARYRPSARQARETNSGTSHIGFRTVINMAKEIN